MIEWTLLGARTREPDFQGHSIFLSWCSVQYVFAGPGGGAARSAFDAQRRTAERNSGCFGKSLSCKMPMRAALRPEHKRRFLREIVISSSPIREIRRGPAACRRRG